MSDSARGPDFLGIGSARCGTSYLYKQLRKHPQIWMPPVKELHYFDHQRQTGYRNKRTRAHFRTMSSKWRRFLKVSPKATADRHFAVTYLTQPRSDSWYRSLFDTPKGLIRGEITPAYCVLPDATIRELREMAPDLKLIFMMRDPIDRSWSSTVRSLGRNRGRSIADVDPEEIMSQFATPGLVEKSNYMAIISRWEKVFPRQNIFYGFMDEIESEPVEFMARVCRFLGVEPISEASRSRLAERVNETSRFGSEIPARYEHRLAEIFAGLNEGLHERFGGPTVRWHERIERLLGSASPSAR